MTAPDDGPMNYVYRTEWALRLRFQEMLIARDRDAFDRRIADDPVYMPVRRFPRDGGRGTIAIFASQASGASLEKLEFFRVIEQAPCNVVYVNDFRSSWYQRGLVGFSTTIAETADCLARILAPFPRPWTFIGSSSGGYAALLFGALLRAEFVTAFSPQTLLTRHVLNLYGGHRTNAAELRAAPPWNDLLSLFASHGRPGRIALHFGEANEIDRRQARRLRGLTECTLSGYPATNHVIARWLSGRDLLMPAIVRGSHLGAAEPG